MNQDGTPNASAGETATGSQSQTTAPTIPIPAPATVPDPKLDELQKQLDIANQRASQLTNEKAAREKADAEASQKQLEEQNEFKTLYEREKAERERLQTERETATKQSVLDTTTSTILGDYSDNVKDVAQSAGLALYDDSEQAQADFKKRLDAIAAKFPDKPAPRVQGNNGNIQPPTADAEQDKLLRQMRFSDRNLADAARSKAFKGIPALDVMRKNAGLTPNE